MNPEKIGESLVYHIERIDCLRYPVKAHPRGFFYGFGIYLKNPLATHNASLKKEIDSFITSYKKKMILYRSASKQNTTAKDLILGFATLIVYLISIAFLAIFFPEIGVAAVIIPAIPITVLVTVYLQKRFEKAADDVAPDIDEETRAFAQKLIDYTKNFFQENGQPTRKFHLELRYNDYEGLEYEKRGEHDYIAHVKLEEGQELA